MSPRNPPNQDTESRQVARESNEWIEQLGTEAGILGRFFVGLVPNVYDSLYLRDLRALDWNVRRKSCDTDGAVAGLKGGSFTLKPV